MKVLKPTTIPFPNNGQFIRNSTATYIEDGILKTAAVNEPRWQDGKLLLEGEATNLMVRSSDFDYWIDNGGLPVVANSMIAPDGTMTADTTSTQNTTRYTPITSVPNAIYSFSVHVKPTDPTKPIRLYADGWGSNAYVDIYPESGSYLLQNSAVSGGSQQLANGWYRIYMQFVPTASNIALHIFQLNPDIHGWWGAQCEIGSNVTSYIPTITTAVTRQADICIGNFSRASTATYIDNNGVLQTAGVNEPRIQGGKLLLEGEATNYVASPDLAAGATFLISGPTTVTDVLPTGMAGSCSEYVASADQGSIRFGDFGGDNSTAYAGSVWARSTTGTCAVYVDVNDQNQREFVLNGSWQRISTTSLPGGTVYRFMDITVLGGQAGAVIRLFGANVTEGLLSSYIPYAGTRAADIHSAGLVYTNATDSRPLWSSVTTYSVGQIIRYNNTVYESLQAANLNKQPDTNPTWWLSLGADNISAAFDGKVGSKTTATDKLRMIVYPGNVVDAVGYLETNAVVVNTSAVDSYGNIAYSNSTGFTESNIENWYDYFFVSPLADPATQVVRQGIPSLDPGLFIGVEMIKSGTVEVGNVLVGYSTTIGKTQYGVKAGIVDYSKKESDEFGNVSIVERPYSKRMQGDVYVNNYDLNKVQRFLYNIRATPVLWMASDNPELAEVSYVYGFYKDFSTTTSYPDVSMCNLDIEGLV